MNSQSFQSSVGEQELAVLRKKLDELDFDLLKTLKARLDCCLQIAEVKRIHDIAMMQPHRIGIVQARAREFGIENDVSTEFLASLYELIIGETCRLENVVIEGR